MSVAEIVTELPKLSPTELRVVRRKLVEIGEEDAEVAAADEAALAGAQMLDRMEAENDAG